jgi:hypothetical protein
MILLPIAVWIATAKSWRGNKSFSRSHRRGRLPPPARNDVFKRAHRD